MKRVELLSTWLQGGLRLVIEIYTHLTTDCVLSSSAVFQTESNLLEHLRCFSSALQAKTPTAARVGRDLGTYGSAQKHISVPRALSICFLNITEAFLKFNVRQVSENAKTSIINNSFAVNGCPPCSYSTLSTEFKVLKDLKKFPSLDFF